MKKSNILLLSAFALSIIFLAIIFVSAKNLLLQEHIMGDGNMVQTDIPMKEFSKIKVSGNVDIYFTQAPFSAGKMEADKNLLDFIEIEVKGDWLHIKATKKINPTQPISIYISAPELDAMRIGASARFKAENTLQTENLSVLNLAGSEVTFMGDFGFLEVDNSAGSRTVISGSTHTAKYKASAGSFIDAQNMISQETQASASAGAEIHLTTKALDASASAGASIFYYGETHIGNQNTSAGASIQRGNR